MKQLRFAQIIASLIALAISIAADAAPESVIHSAAASKHWTADNGNGTYSNPLYYGEFEDSDVLRVGDDYYLAGTTMHMNPAVEILHSKDLVNCELAGYCTNRLDLSPACRLEDGRGIYGQGIWAHRPAKVANVSNGKQSNELQRRGDFYPVQQPFT